MARKYKPDWCRMSIAEAFSSQDKAVLFYQEWIKHVHSSIPAHRLLTWDSVSILSILTFVLQNVAFSDLKRKYVKHKARSHDVLKPLDIQNLP